MDEPCATLEASEPIFEGRIFKVHRDRVRLPNGRTVPMEVVRHGPSVVLIAQPDPDHVVLIKQYRYVIDRWIWELPAGGVDAGEDPARGAARECAEEINLVPSSVERLGGFFPTPGFCDEEMVFFRLTGLRAVTADAGPVEKDEDELLSVRVFSLSEARELLKRGEIVDMKTVVGLALL